MRTIMAINLSVLAQQETKSQALEAQLCTLHNVVYIRTVPDVLRDCICSNYEFNEIANFN
jgi:hypothetical protein